MHAYSFEKLDVWKETIKLSTSIYKIIQTFSDNEKFGLISQMRRCSVSISSNIAEGTARLTNKDKAHFMTLSYSSGLELLNQAIIAKELEFITKKTIKLLDLKLNLYLTKLTLYEIIFSNHSINNLTTHD